MTKNAVGSKGFDYRPDIAPGCGKRNDRLWVAFRILRLVAWWIVAALAALGMLLPPTARAPGRPTARQNYAKYNAQAKQVKRCAQGRARSAAASRQLCAHIAT